MIQSNNEVVYHFSMSLSAVEDDAVKLIAIKVGCHVQVGSIDRLN